MKPRRVIDNDVTPSGERVELCFEAGRYVVKIDGAVLMSSATHGSEEAMVAVAAERLHPRRPTTVLVGGLGMGYTLRAALDHFGPDTQVTVAELLPMIVRHHRGELGTLARFPLDDPRVTLHEGDVRQPLFRGGWDAVLMDIDNGPEPFTVASNADLYRGAGLRRMASALAPSGVLVVWSASPSPAFEREARRLGLTIEARPVRARASAKGPRHTLFVIQAAG